MIRMETPLGGAVHGSWREEPALPGAESVTDPYLRLLPIASAFHSRPLEAVTREAEPRTGMPAPGPLVPAQS